MGNSIKQAKNMIKKAIQSYLLKQDDGTYMIPMVNQLPVYLEGPPGVGKTQICSQIAKELGIGFLSYSLTHYTRNSVLGLPVIETLSDGSKFTQYTVSEIIAAVQEKVLAGEKEGVLLLDEFACMSESIFPIMLAFLQTRNIGKYTLPDGWIVILCSNPPKYNKSSRKLDNALLDRVKKIEIDFEQDCFIEYASQNDMDPIIIEYLRTQPDDVYHIDGDELVTCRGWENLDYMLKTYRLLGEKITREDIQMVIKSEEIADSFYEFRELLDFQFSSKHMERVLNGIWDENDIKMFDQLNMQQKELAMGKFETYFLQKTKQDRANYENKQRAVSDEKINKTSAMIDQLFAFFYSVQGSELFVNNVFEMINRDDWFLEVISYQKSEEYMRYAHKLYFGGVA